MSEAMEKLSNEERIKTLELVVLFLAKELGVCVDLENHTAYMQTERAKADQDTMVALELLGVEII